MLIISFKKLYKKLLLIKMKSYTSIMVDDWFRLHGGILKSIGESMDLLHQGYSTHGPRAACGPWASVGRPGKGISLYTMRYEYWSLSH